MAKKRVRHCRRNVLAGIAAAAGFAAVARVPGVDAGGPGTATTAPADITDITAIPSLGALAASRGILFGTAFDIESIGTPAEAALYRHHARILTTDLAMKFAILRPEEGPARFENADRLVAWAALAGIPLRGHCLVWNEGNPDWLSKLTAARRAYWLDRHIDEVMGRYAGRLHSWDVVNEPFWPGHGKSGGFRDGPWLDALGPDYVVRAMKRARAADPGATLVINEAGPEWENPWGPAEPFRDGLLKLIDRVQESGTTVDAVGLQCHWFPDFRFDETSFRAYVRKLAAKVRSVYLTELDVDDARIRGDIATRDRAVADRFRQLVTAALSEPAIAAIITWQMADAANWITRETRMWGALGRPPRPTPFDEHYRPKAAYYALAEAFATRR